MISYVTYNPKYIINFPEINKYYKQIINNQIGKKQRKFNQGKQV